MKYTMTFADLFSNDAEPLRNPDQVWVPKHDPSKYPVCPDCKRIYEEMMG